MGPSMVTSGGLQALTPNISLINYETAACCAKSTKNVASNSVTTPLVCAQLWFTNVTRTEDILHTV